ncbi:hypothetical protein [Synechococcus sp. KORDI-100]|nr:hypothetical protein [Synechococcus sp. KORDI-100]
MPFAHGLEKPAGNSRDLRADAITRQENDTVLNHGEDQPDSR